MTLRRDSPFLAVIICCSRATWRNYIKLFVLYSERSAGTRSNLECKVRSMKVWKKKLKAYPKVSGMAGASTAYIVDTSAASDRVIERRLKRIGNKFQCVEKVTLSGTVTPDEDRQRSEIYAALCDALEVLDGYAPQKRRGRAEHAPIICAPLYASFAIASSTCSGVGMTGSSTTWPLNHSNSPLSRCMTSL